MKESSRKRLTMEDARREVAEMEAQILQKVLTKKD